MGGMGERIMKEEYNYECGCEAVMSYGEGEEDESDIQGRGEEGEAR